MAIKYHKTQPKSPKPGITPPKKATLCPSKKFFWKSVKKTGGLNIKRATGTLYGRGKDQMPDYHPIYSTEGNVMYFAYRDNFFTYEGKHWVGRYLYKPSWGDSLCGIGGFPEGSIVGTDPYGDKLSFHSAVSGPHRRYYHCAVPPTPLKPIVPLMVANVPIQWGEQSPHRIFDEVCLTTSPGGPFLQG